MSGEASNESNVNRNPRDELASLVREAVTSGDIGALRAQLASVNQLLTGIDAGDFDGSEFTEQQLAERLQDFIADAQRYHDSSVVIYLGDSGLSRLSIATYKDSVIMGLTPSSTSDVVAKWEALKQ